MFTICGRERVKSQNYLFIANIGTLMIIVKFIYKNNRDTEQEKNIISSIFTVSMKIAQNQQRIAETLFIRS